MSPQIPKGLSELEAKERLDRDGYNELPTSKSRNILALAFDVLKEPMFLLLVACGLIYLFVGEVTDAMMLLAFVFVIIGITFYQERKTERALEALRDLSSPRALVIRDGVEKRIAGREVVKDDVIVLVEGDRIPADALLLESSYLSVDESLLTGESMPVRKTCTAQPGGPAKPGGDDTPWLFSGTLLVKGKALARVTSTGGNTEIGKIGKALQTVESSETPLSKQTGKLVRNFAIVGMITCTLVVIFYTLTRGSLTGGILAGIALAMAMIPEEFPVVLSIFMALGAWRIAQKQVLTRRVPAVETLGAATVLCVDKTGTLTQNRMSVSKIVVNDEVLSLASDETKILPETFHQIFEFGILASQADPFDPMEKAFFELGDRYLSQTEHLHRDWELEREYPLSDALLAMSHVWRRSDSDLWAVAAKGAPEAIVDLCHLSQIEQERVARNVNLLAADGLRVLAVAKADFQKPSFPDSQHDFQFRFLGLVGFADPVRPTVRHAIQECAEAGIQVVMITGDYPATAQNIARQIGLAMPEPPIAGLELDAMSEPELIAHAGKASIFARVVPEQKLRIVNAFRANNDVVAMTGDGVNDAPALKAADIGIAMGGRGTDVAREAADLVLLDDDFSSIVHAVRLGRRIFDNLKKAIAYILAVHVPIAGLSLLPVLFKWPLILLPVHIVFLEMVIDPACTVVFEVEPEEKNVMRRPPRDRKEPLLSRYTLFLSLAQGFGVLCIVMLLFALLQAGGFSENESRAAAFAALLLGNLALIVSNRSASQSTLAILNVPNSAMWWVLGIASTVLLLVLYLPLLQRTFHFAALDGQALAAVLIAAGGIFVWLDVVKKMILWWTVRTRKPLAG